MVISNLLIEVRYKINDMERRSFSDYQLMHFYNEGNRLVRRLILDQFPMMLLSSVESTASTTKNTLTNKPIKIIEIRIDGQKIDPIDATTIKDKTRTGKPTGYYLTNLKDINWYPVPDISYPFEVLLIPEGAVLTETADSGLPSEVEDLLVKYIAARCGAGDVNEVLAEIQNIGKLLGDIEPTTTEIQGYW